MPKRHHHTESRLNNLSVNADPEHPVYREAATEIQKRLRYMTEKHSQVFVGHLEFRFPPEMETLGFSRRVPDPKNMWKIMLFSMISKGAIGCRLQGKKCRKVPFLRSWKPCKPIRSERQFFVSDQWVVTYFELKLRVVGSTLWVYHFFWSHRRFCRPCPGTGTRNFLSSEGKNVSRL